MLRRSKDTENSSTAACYGEQRRYDKAEVHLQPGIAEQPGSRSAESDEVDERRHITVVRQVMGQDSNEEAGSAKRWAGSERSTMYRLWDNIVEIA